MLSASGLKRVSEGHTNLTPGLLMGCRLAQVAAYTGGPAEQVLHHTGTGFWGGGQQRSRVSPTAYGLPIYVSQSGAWEGEYGVRGNCVWGSF